MGITAKPTGKMRGILKRIDNEKEKEKKSMRKVLTRKDKDGE